MTVAKEVSELLARLRDEGVDLMSNPESGLKRLAEMVIGGAVSSAAFIEIIEQAGSPELLKALEATAQNAHGSLRRILRQASFRLRRLSGTESGPARFDTRDLGKGESDNDVDDVKEPRHEDGASAQVSVVPELEALATSFDPTGARIIWIIKLLPQGGVRRLSAVVSYRDGLLAASLSRLSRRELRTERQELETSLNINFFDIDWKLADFILCEAYRITPPLERAKVGTFLQLRAELIPGPIPDKIEHPIYHELSAIGDIRPSPSLLDDLALTGLLPSSEEISPFVAEIEQARQSPLILSRAQERDRLEQVIDKAIRQLLADDKRDRVRRYLEDVAYYFVRVGKVENARWAASAALMLREGGDVTHSPFFRRWIEKAIGSALAEKARSERESPRLVLTPGEIMRLSKRSR